MLGCSQLPHDVTTAYFLKGKLVKNVVGPQKSDQELRVSYKPTAFRRRVVDEPEHKVRRVWKVYQFRRVTLRNASA